VGRTIPSWRIIVEKEIAAMSRFKQFLGPEDRAVWVECGKTFTAMMGAQWRNVFYMNREFSIKHRRWSGSR